MHPVTEKRRAQRQRLISMLGGKCAHCGSTENLEFDHLNPSDKEYKISEILDFSEDKLQEEAKKCQLLCKKCHHKKTLEKQEYGKEMHGLWRFKKHKCRCPQCMEANDKYNKYRRAIYKVLNF